MFYIFEHRGMCLIEGRGTTADGTSGAGGLKESLKEAHTSIIDMAIAALFFSVGFNSLGLIAEVRLFAPWLHRSSHRECPSSAR